MLEAEFQCIDGRYYFRLADALLMKKRPARQTVIQCGGKTYPLRRKLSFLSLAFQQNSRYFNKATTV
ncbi:hypothetical protein Q4491_19130 [Photobacterium sp. 2_MG-2023]|uniref:hypothetical protein n=1 Tax=Photobacterium sp. 2_MG-2023 TaxID=3062663 RepID=UPI0026E2D080|nr:hypothetical protein [Photobacterium sp. 2_MG-2023]MDO6583457.1 hypothetical protein [Photobacterium sp. 2_MG-2023]